MKKTTRAVTAAIILTLILAAVSVGVYAYLMSKTEKENEFRIGEGKVEVTETFTEPRYMEMQNSFNKLVSVKNTGSSTQYVRVFLDFSDSSVRDKSTIEYPKDNGTAEGSWTAFLADLPTGWEYIPLSGDDADPDLGGYFYYTEALAPGETTPPLIMGINTDYRAYNPDTNTVDITDTNTDRITDFDVIVYTESVQIVETGTGQVYTPPADPAPAGAEPPWKAAWRSFLTRSSQSP